MTVIALLRCHHVIMMVLFLFCWILFFMPCLFCCPENCCIKWLTIRSAKAPKSVITKLKSQWSWQFLPLDDCSTKNLHGDALHAAMTLQRLKNCPLCFLGYQRGETVTYLPCHLFKILHRKNSHHFSTKTSLSQEISFTPNGTTSVFHTSQSGSKGLKSNDATNSADKLTNRFSDYSTNEPLSAFFDESHVMHQDCIMQWL